MEQSDMRAILELVTRFQTRAQSIKRYEKNPFVEGDNIAEHLARGARLLVCIAPQLKAEFPDQAGIVEEALICFLVHDDDEIIDGFDIPTAIKIHNQKDGEEIAKFTEAVSSLPADSKNTLIDAFSSFRQKSTLAAKIAKAADNLTGNQLVIEQGIGLVNPDSARFCIEYAEKVKGFSETIDALVDAQTAQIVEFRNVLKNDASKMEEIWVRFGMPDAEKLQELLTIDVTTHVLDKDKVYTPIDML